uniref:Secreted protein n=1 Tax=Trichobilharzia regenti TaxID=157069 RepID=A0AA85IMP8_TRIRE
MFQNSFKWCVYVFILYVLFSSLNSSTTITVACKFLKQKRLLCIDLNMKSSLPQDDFHTPSVFLSITYHCIHSFELKDATPTPLT